MLTTVPRSPDNAPAEYQSLIQVIAKETALTAAAAYRAAWRTWQSLAVAGIGQLATCGRKPAARLRLVESPVPAEPTTPVSAAKDPVGSLELVTDADGAHRFTLTTGDGETIVTSRSYQDAKSARGGMLSFMKNAVLEERYARGTDSLGAHVFELKAGNNRVIWTSAPYETEEEMEADLARLISIVREASTIH